MLGGCGMDYILRSYQQRAGMTYELITFNDLARRYMRKQADPLAIEGFYSVSREVKRQFTEKARKDKLLDKDENYQMVALFRDTQAGDRDYIEVPLERDYQLSYAIRGEVKAGADRNVFVYTHILRKQRETYTMVRDSETGILEGVRTEERNGSRIVYRIIFTPLSSGQR
jgi:hypothetical protein